VNAQTQQQHFTLPPLYPITDEKMSGLSHAEQVSCLAQGGAKLIQLREKEMSPREFYESARAALEVARTYSVRLIINDRVDLALALNADGVHLGQDDLPPAAARELLGPHALIGYSTHNLEQATEAAHLPINYLALGPIFPTASKQNPDPVVGPDLLRLIRARVPHLPLVAIGGITRENARAALNAGADSVAVIAALLSPPATAPNLITQRTTDMLQTLSTG
jgi:thiamine-phosphate pyrophosphorylase